MRRLGPAPLLRPRLRTPDAPRTNRHLFSLSCRTGSSLQPRFASHHHHHHHQHIRFAPRPLAAQPARTPLLQLAPRSISSTAPRNMASVPPSRRMGELNAFLCRENQMC